MKKREHDIVYFTLWTDTEDCALPQPYKFDCGITVWILSLKLLNEAKLSHIFLLLLPDIKGTFFPDREDQADILLKVNTQQKSVRNWRY